MINGLIVCLKESRTYIQIKTNMSENEQHIYHYYRLRLCKKQSHIEVCLI